MAQWKEREVESDGMPEVATAPTSARLAERGLRRSVGFDGAGADFGKPSAASRREQG